MEPQCNRMLKYNIKNLEFKKYIIFKKKEVTEEFKNACAEECENLRILPEKVLNLALK
jgi:hypothetical protein